MVGLGETKEEIIEAMDDLLVHDVDIITSVLDQNHYHSH